MGGRMSNVYAVSQHDDLRSIIAHNQTTKNRVSARWNRTDRTIDLHSLPVCLYWCRTIDWIVALDAVGHAFSRSCSCLWLPTLGIRVFSLLTIS